METSSDLCCLSEKGCTALVSALSKAISIQPPCDLPTFSLVPWKFIQELKVHLSGAGIHVLSTRLEGSAATACACPDAVTHYNDLDVVFHLGGDSSSVLHLAREAIVTCMAGLIPMPFLEALELAQFYFSKMFLKESGLTGDAWGLLSLAGQEGCPGIDIKFVCKCARSFQFSMDSLFILLDAPLRLLEGSGGVQDGKMSIFLTTNLRQEKMVGSVYGPVEEVCEHIRDKIIATSEVSDPARIYGGCLMKYAALLAEGYRVAPWLDRAALERYMCTRFHIDFPDHEYSRRTQLPLQVERLNQYLLTHFATAPDRGCQFMRVLHAIVARAYKTGRSCGVLLHTLNAYIADLMHWNALVDDACDRPSAPSSPSSSPKLDKDKASPDAGKRTRSPHSRHRRARRASCCKLEVDAGSLALASRAGTTA